MGHSNIFYDLRDALAEPGCPVCRLTLAAVQHYIESIDYDSVNDPDFRSATRAAQGFCNVHAYQWLKQAHVLGTAMIYAQICADTQDELNHLSLHKLGVFSALSARLEHQPEGGADCDILVPLGQCPVCQSAKRRERMLIDGLLVALAEPAFCEQYRAGSHGVCVPHLHLALCAAKDEIVFTTLRDVAREHQQELADQLAEIIRKHDYRFRDEPTGEERGATRRAVEHFTGDLGLEFKGAPGA